MLDIGVFEVTATAALPIPVPESTVTQAASATGVPTRTIRMLCAEYGSPLARRVGKSWIVDTDLLVELVTLRQGRDSAPQAPAEPPQEGATVIEAAEFAGVSIPTVRRWCKLIPHLTWTPESAPVRRQWRINPVVLTIVINLRAEDPHIRDEKLARVTAERFASLTAFYRALQRPGVSDALKAALAERFRPFWERRHRPPPDDAAAAQPSDGEAANGSR